MTTPAPAPAVPPLRDVTDDEIFAKRPFEFALGRALMNFGALEYSVLAGIAELVPFLPNLNLDAKLETTFCRSLTRYDSYVRKLITRRSLLAYHEKLMKTLWALGERRNELVHGAWFDAPDHDRDKEKAKVRRHTTLKALTSPSHAADFITPVEIVNWFNEVYLQRRAFDAHRAMVLHYVNDAQVVAAKRKLQPKPSPRRGG